MDCTPRTLRRMRAGRRASAGAVACAALVASLVVPFTDVQAQNRDPSVGVARASTVVDPAAPKTALAVRAPSAIRVDGVLDEDAWKNAPPITQFWQRDPHEGEPGSEPTEARIVYGNDAIYIGVRARDSHPAEFRAQLTRRDEDSPSDWIAVAIDSYHDHRTGYAFFVNPAGVKRDVYLFDDGNDDDSWNAVWDVATSRDDEGWTAEFRIPWSQLRFSAAPTHDFGFQVVRMISRLNEEQHWRLMGKDQSGVVSRFGDLSGIEGIEPPRRVEVMPYMAGTEAFGPAEAGNPFQTGHAGAGRVGADLNVGLTSNLTLSATVNPDFGQVEADPAVVNLSAFETFYPEKRPFFNEGLDIFRFPILLGDGDGANEQLFYTRRIGRAPQGEADPRAGFAETIDQTTILGAGKLSGKTASGWTMGFLGALTAEERADVVAGDGTMARDVVEPRTGYFVGRLSKDLRGGLTKIGVFSTGVTRALPDNLQWLHSAAYSGGVDFGHRFLDDNYFVDGWLVGSYVQGSEEAISETQLSSARYYQRPDNTHVTYDPTRTSLSGYAGQFVVGKRKGFLLFSTGFDTRSPGFEVNDAGYQREADRTIQFAWVGLRWNKPGKVFRRLGLNFNQNTVWTYGWERIGTGGNINGWGEFLNYWDANFGISQNFEALNTGALRGGPAFLRPPTTSSWFGFSSDHRKALSFGAYGSVFLQPASDTRGLEVGPQISWRPASNLDLSFSPGYFKQRDTWQYLTQEDVAGEPQYIFGVLDQTLVSTTFRGNMTFTPTLSLQVYAQPFVTTGAYQGYRRVADPRADQFSGRFEDFGPDQVFDDNGEISLDVTGDGTPDIALGNPNFTYVSFRSNVVLRWEYKLGSTLFLVWQHGREGSNTDPNFSFGQGLQDMFRLDAQNTFVVKVNYWLSM
jgi:hypothetical protein